MQTIFGTPSKPLFEEEGWLFESQITPRDLREHKTEVITFEETPEEKQEFDDFWGPAIYKNEYTTPRVDFYDDFPFMQNYPPYKKWLNLLHRGALKVKYLIIKKP